MGRDGGVGRGCRAGVYGGVFMSQPGVRAVNGGGGVGRGCRTGVGV